MQNLHDKVIVVIGASQGIGKAIALRMAREGCTLCLIARNKNLLEQVMENTRLGKDKVFIYPLDASDFALLGGTLKSIESKFGRIDILINVAGLGTFKKFIDTSFNEVVQPALIPYTSTMVACHTVLPGMIKRKIGHIVNLSSPAGYIPMPYMAPYISSRYAIIGFTLSLYEELRSSDIGVSLVCPGFVDTDYFEKNNTSKEWFPKISKYFPISSVDMVAEKVLYAISSRKKEIIFPVSLSIFIKFTRTFPNITIFILRSIGLWSPKNLISPND